MAEVVGQIAGGLPDSPRPHIRPLFYSALLGITCNLGEIKAAVAYEQMIE